jgi:hypothetical protein
MRSYFAGCILVIAVSNVFAAPSPAVTRTCLKANNASATVKYTPIESSDWLVSEDEDEKRTETTLRHGKQTIGVWEVKSPPAFGLIANGSAIALDHVTSVTAGQAPVSFNPYLAMWGTVREGARSYVCITFNFEGLGQSGSYQDIRGAYLIERAGRSKRVPKVFYVAGRASE